VMTVTLMLAAALSLCVYLSGRNFMVHDLRVSWLRRSLMVYEAFPSYDEMLFMFWIPLRSFERRAIARAEARKVSIRGGA